MYISRCKYNDNPNNDNHSSTAVNNDDYHNKIYNNSRSHTVNDNEVFVENS